ncbi:MAG: hypothetical protein DLM66_02870 [Candidatus Dormiibacter spiritus]|nr:MAG: hypothetical protein DLM66_02870 [Candidatus Dormibacteraeota bacterium]
MRRLEAGEFEPWRQLRLTARQEAPLAFGWTCARERQHPVSVGRERTAAFATGDQRVMFVAVAATGCSTPAPAALPGLALAAAHGGLPAGRPELVGPGRGHPGRGFRPSGADEQGNVWTDRCDKPVYRGWMDAPKSTARRSRLTPRSGFGMS